MKTIISLSVVLLASLSWASTTEVDTATVEQETPIRVVELDHVIQNIHADLLQLQQNQTWLSGYTNKCLWEGHVIFYMPKIPKGFLAQQPNQLLIGYVAIDQKKELKYENDLEEVPFCRFPSMKAKVYAKILIRGKENAECVTAIRECIIKRCEVMHKDLASRGHVLTFNK